MGRHLLVNQYGPDESLLRCGTHMKRTMIYLAVSLLLIAGVGCDRGRQKFTAGHSTGERPIAETSNLCSKENKLYSPGAFLETNGGREVCVNGRWEWAIGQSPKSSATQQFCWDEQRTHQYPAGTVRKSEAGVEVCRSGTWTK